MMRNIFTWWWHQHQLKCFPLPVSIVCLVATFIIIVNFHQKHCSPLFYVQIIKINEILCAIHNSTNGQWKIWENSAMSNKRNWKYAAVMTYCAKLLTLSNWYADWIPSKFKGIRSLPHKNIYAFIVFFCRHSQKKNLTSFEFVLPPFHSI